MEVNCQCDPCESALAGAPPDMRLGDTCLMCLQRECDRCGTTIDIDEEHMIVMSAWPLAGDLPGYIDVCDKCLQPNDKEYHP